MTIISVEQQPSPKQTIDRAQHEVHAGVWCDQCGREPICGPRYSSRVDLFRELDRGLQALGVSEQHHKQKAAQKEGTAFICRQKGDESEPPSHDLCLECWQRLEPASQRLLGLKFVKEVQVAQRCWQGEAPGAVAEFAAGVQHLSVSLEVHVLSLTMSH